MTHGLEWACSTTLRNCDNLLSLIVIVRTMTEKYCKYK